MKRWRPRSNLQLVSDIGTRSTRLFGQINSLALKFRTELTAGWIFGHGYSPGKGQKYLDLDSIKKCAGPQVLLREVGMVLEALSFLIPIVEEFRRNYVAVLDELLSIYEKEHIRVCTIYNKIPTAPASHLPKETMLALGLFNDVITEEVNRRGLRLIDLRVICDSADCYSEASPIEPSEEGGRRIVKAILESLQS